MKRAKKVGLWAVYVGIIAVSALFVAVAALPAMLWLAEWDAEQSYSERNDDRG